MIGGILRRIVSSISKFFRKVFGPGATAGAKAVHTAGKSSAGEAASVGAGFDRSDHAVSAARQTRDHGRQRIFLFDIMQRPRLQERAASDLTVDNAAGISDESRLFYELDFQLFPGGDLFYEQVEDAYLKQALGYAEGRIDRQYLDEMTVFRRLMNGNSRVMLVYVTSAALLLALAAGYFFSQSSAMAQLAAGPLAALGAYAGPFVFFAALMAALVLIWICFEWPFKFAVHKSVQNLDNYITSKFGRINHKFQTANRRALIVDRDKRMTEREELRDEAGAWTVSYQWLAIRLLFCEMIIRNRFYQIRRNTTLYLILSIAVCTAIIAGAFSLMGVWGENFLVLGAYLAAAALFIMLLIAVLSRTAPMIFSNVAVQEWNRFHLLNLRQTIADHVGADKVQIITHRDRNRME